MIALNLNDIVRVKLTTKGYNIYCTYITNNSQINKINKIKEDIILETELWDIMKIFGNYFYVGSEPLFENNEIIINPIRDIGKRRYKC